MNSGLITSLRSFTAYGGAPSRALNFGSPYARSNKAYQNHLISENILRKATQLTEDLAAINTQTKAFQTNQTPKNKGFTPIEYAEQQLTNSIQAIRDLREKLGIETPAGTISKNDFLQTLANKDRGILLDTKS